MMVWRRTKSGGAESPAAAVVSPCRDGDENKVPRGRIPMIVGGRCGDDDGERVLVPVSLLGDPCIAELLDMAAQQYGFGQPGVLRVPCDAGHFRRVVVECELRKGSGQPQAA